MNSVNRNRAAHLKELMMKSKLNMFILFLLVVLAGGTFIGCTDDDSGTPSISYIRVTNPDASDSLLVAAGQGQMIAIMGQNLGSVREIWFNDQMATLQPNLITNSTIITRIPTQIPGTVSDELRMIFQDGYMLIHDFTTDINKPSLVRMKSEYADPGTEGVIYGNFFYEPITVRFTGGSEATLTYVSDEELRFTIPNDAERGPITVTSPFGESESAFWYKDNRNIFVSFDAAPYSGMWKSDSYIVESDGAIPNISGNFLRLNESLPAWAFFEVYGGPKEGSQSAETKNIPSGALINPSAYAFKFEINTQQSFVGGRMRLYIGNAVNDQLDAERQANFYDWQANIFTQGKWETVTIPFADVYRAAKNFKQDADGYAIFIYFHGPNAVPHNFGMDNFRVVPNVPN